MAQISGHLHIGRAERVGSFLSLMCAIHCLALPFLMTVVPLIGFGFLLDSAFEAGMLAVALLCAVLSLCWGHRIHGRRWLFGLVVIAVGLFVAGHAYHELQDGSGATMHMILMVLGAIFLVGAQYVNKRLCRSCRSCNEEVTVSTEKTSCCSGHS